MAKFEAKIYVLQSEWEIRWVTIDANSEEEAKEKIETQDYEVTEQKMGDIQDCHLEVDIDYIKKEETDEC